MPIIQTKFCFLLRLLKNGKARPPTPWCQTFVAERAFANKGRPIMLREIPSGCGRAGRAAWRGASLGGTLLGLLLAMCSSSPASEPPSSDYDLIIEHGRIIDGTGAPW